MRVHLISDLHLEPGQHDLNAVFRRYLAGPAREAETLYILGDLFEVWAGDRVSASDYAADIDALAGLAAAGTAIRFIPGNRDFLCGRQFAAAAGLTLAAEPEPLTLPDGRRALLLHGDTLCTDDRGYQRFRRVVRHPGVQRVYFALPLAWRRQLARRLRAGASRRTGHKPPAIMDVNEQAVGACFERHGVDCLIHGHTHRPATHRYAGDRERWVLADWRAGRGEALVADARGLSRLALS